jgi:hypothetical protein
MEIDRTRFLSLVATLASIAACAKEAAPPQAAAQGQAGNQGATTDILPFAQADDAGLTALQALARAAEATPAPKPVPEAPETEMADFDPNGKHSCAELKCPIGPTSESVDVVRICRKLESTLIAPRFQHFIQCMLHSNNSERMCTSAIIGTERGECLRGWASVQEITADAPKICEPIVQRCARTGPGPLKQESCERMVSVTKASGRKRLLACMAEGCGTAERYCYGGY